MFPSSVSAARSAAEVADALVDARDRERRAAAEKWLLVAEWAAVHHAGTVPAAAVVPGMERTIPAGAAGTPRVGEFAAVELGVLLGTTTHYAKALLADVANLQHRHPLLWAAVTAGRVPQWKASHVARRCATAELSLEEARFVDTATVTECQTLPWTRFRPVLEAKIIEAAPGSAETRRLEEATRAYLGSSRTDEHGLRTLYARTQAGDVALFLAVADQIAQILALQGDPDEADMRRAKALGILADPARALRLLLEAKTGPYGQAGESPSTDPLDPWVQRQQQRLERSGHVEVPTDLPLPDPDPPLVEQVRGARPSTGSGTTEGPSVETTDRSPDPDPAPEPDPEPVGCTCRHDPATVAALTAAVQALKSPLLGPKAVLYVHLTPDSDLARVEDLGPATLAQAIAWLGHRQVSVRPVLDLREHHTADSYEIPTKLREAVILRWPIERFPHGTLPSRHCDQDHRRPHNKGGQTSLPNLDPHSRLHHRVKTHGKGWKVKRIAADATYWRTPTGHWTRVDNHGTHWVGKPDSLLEHHLETLLRAHAS